MFVALILTLTVQFSLFAQDQLPMTFADGVTAYNEKDFKQAQSIFVGLLETTPENPTLLYNLGLVEFQMENWGLALGLWRKALYLNPGDTPTELAIAYAEEKMSTTQKAPSLFSSIFETLVRWPLSLWLFISLLTAFAALWFSIENGIQKKKPFLHWPPWLLTIIPISFMLVCFSGIVLSEKAQIKGTVVKDGLQTHAAPSDSSPTLGDLSSGQIVNIERQSGEWIQIRTKGGIPGWVPQKSIIAYGGL